MGLFTKKKSRIELIREKIDSLNHKFLRYYIDENYCNQLNFYCEIIFEGKPITMKQKFFLNFSVSLGELTQEWADELYNEILSNHLIMKEEEKQLLLKKEQETIRAQYLSTLCTPEGFRSAVLEIMNTK
jgi:hypothetical protein